MDDQNNLPDPRNTSGPSSTSSAVLLKTVLIIIWIVLLAAILLAEEAFRPPPIKRNDIKSLEHYLYAKFLHASEDERFGSASFILMQKGKVAARHAFGIANRQNGTVSDADSTLYLLCSVSKAVTAWGVMKLVQDGKIGLNDPVIGYLRRWKLRGNDGFAGKVTIQHLLSHTAGIDDGFGTSGFLDDDDMPSIESWLDNPKDANSGAPHPTRVVREPGTSLSYSSAGYGVLQLLIEEVSGNPFSQYMDETVLRPLGASMSTYNVEDVIEQGRIGCLADNYDVDLNAHPHRKFANMAGVSVRITANDMAKFLSAYFNDNAVLSKESIAEILTPAPGTASMWALGHEVYGSNGSGGWLVGHGGGAFPRTGASMRINPATGNAIAIMMTGGPEMIDPYMKDWTYWETGQILFDIRNIIRNRSIVFVIAATLGALVIVILGRVSAGRVRHPGFLQRS